MGSPIESWDAAEAYFTFADSPALLGLFLIVAIGIVVGVIAATYLHENKSFNDL
ncbi:MAG: hypothetical protein AAF384_13300 [Pseudomonadota bacterium]